MHFCKENQYLQEGLVEMIEKRDKIVGWDSNPPLPTRRVLNLCAAATARSKNLYKERP